MKDFLQRSHTLWVVIRGILLLVFAVIIFTTNFTVDQRHPLDFAGDLRNIVFYIFHLIMFVYEVQSKRKPFLTRSFAGGLSFLFSLGLLFTAIGPYLFFSHSERPTSIALLAFLPLAVWMFYLAFLMPWTYKPLKRKNIKTSNVNYADYLLFFQQLL